MAEREPILRPALGVFLAVAVAAFLLGTWTRVRALGFDEACAVLRDGDPDHEERLAAARVVLERGLSRGDRRSLVLAASAALATNDAEGLSRAAAALGPPAPERIVLPDAISIPEAGLGEAAVVQLLQAMSAETDGRTEAARLLYRRAVAASELWNLTLASDLARAGRARLR